MPPDTALTTEERAAQEAVRGQGLCGAIGNGRVCIRDPHEGSHGFEDTPTWHSEIVQAGLVGLHRIDCWNDDHQDCRDIVFAVLTGLADAGYKVRAGDAP